MVHGATAVSLVRARRLGSVATARILKKLGLQSDGAVARLMKGSIFSFAGAASARVMNVITAVIVARVLGQQGFGAYGIIQGTVVAVSALAGMGLGATATKYVAELREKDPARARAISALADMVAFVSSTLFAVLLWAAAPWLAAQTLADAGMADPLRIGAVAVGFTAYGAAQTGVLMGFERFDLVALTGLFGAVAAIPLCGGGAYLFGIRGAVWGLSGAAGITCIVNLVLVRRCAKDAAVPSGYRGLLREWPILFRFSIPSVLCNVLVTATAWIVNAMIVNSQNGYAEMGIFSAALQWRNAALFLPSAVTTVALPILANIGGDGVHRKRTGVIRVSFLLSGGIALLTTIGIAAAAPWLMAAYGKSFSAGIPTLILLLVSGVLIAVNNVVGAELASRDRVWLGALFCAGLCGLQVVFGLCFVGGHGALGAATAVLLAYLGHTVWQGVYLYAVSRFSEKNECTP